MADLRESFPILEDDATGAGQAPTARIEGEVAAGKEGLIGFSFKDSSGNVVLPQLTADGKLPVDTEATNANCLNDAGEDAAGSASLVEIASITLVASKDVFNIGFMGSCLREALFQIVQVNDATETVLGEFIVGPGMYTHSDQLHCLEFSAGATGTQALKLKAKNFDKLSSLRGTITCEQAV